MINNYAEYRQYLADIGYSFPEIALSDDGRSYVMADPGRVLTKERSLSRYPLLEVTRPTAAIRVQGKTGTYVYEGEIAVLSHCQNDDFAEQEAAMEANEEIVHRIASKMVEDRFTWGDRLEIIPIRNTSMDNLWGWGLRFQVQARRDLCYRGEAIDFGLLRIEPVFVIGQTDLSLALDLNAYSATWTANDLPSKVKALKGLAYQIEQGEGTIRAYEDYGQLVIVGSAGASVSADLSLPGHDWKEVSYGA